MMDWRSQSPHLNSKFRASWRIKLAGLPAIQREVFGWWSRRPGKRWCWSSQDKYWHYRQVKFVSQVYLGHSEVQLHQGEKEEQQQTCRPGCCTTELIYTSWSHNRRRFNVLSCESQFSQSGWVSMWQELNINARRERWNQIEQLSPQFDHEIISFNNLS